ncbi:hypothetical protein F5Y14DRAFT_394170 [Nemania sp. NC0429]|nr:hypothetical protein F5Y14DRAFT_394170 [Nemania sp. NC0429]
MAQTRAQRAAEIRRYTADQGQVPPTRKPQRLKTTQAKDRKRAVEDTPDRSSKPSAKRPRLGLSTDRDSLDNAAANNIIPQNPIDFWTKEGHWPHQYFESDMEHQGVLVRKRSNSNTSTTPSDQNPREGKSTPYRDPRYESLLQTEGVYMETSEQGIADKSERICRDFLYGTQPNPKARGSVFDDSVFEKTCKNLRNKNEARVIQNVSRLLVPSAETLALYNTNKRLAILTESVNESWNNSIPLTGTRPQPDYSVGFRRDAFSLEQLKKLSPLISNFITGDLSFFIATYYISILSFSSL